jgi:hypothetical protein
MPYLPRAPLLSHVRQDFDPPAVPHAGDRAAVREVHIWRRGVVLSGRRKMRHALMHGDLVAEVEREHGRKLSKLVDDLGRLAWVALLDALMRASTLRGKVRLEVIQPSTFLHHRGVFTVHVNAGFAPLVSQRSMKSRISSWVSTSSSGLTQTRMGQRRVHRRTLSRNE